MTAQPQESPPAVAAPPAEEKPKSETEHWAISVLLIAEPGEGDWEKAVAAWDSYMERSGRDWEIIVVDDGTGKGIKKSNRYPKLRVVSHAEPQGYGECLRKGLAAVLHPLLVITTCDARYRPGDLKALLTDIDKYRLVLGWRKPEPRAPTGRERLLHCLDILLFGWLYLFRMILGHHVNRKEECATRREKVMSFVARWIFGIPFADPGCRYLLARRSAFARIAVQSRGPFAHWEILAKATFLANAVFDDLHEEPVTYRPPAKPEAGPWLGDLWRDARSLFQQPDFGPTVLPKQK